MIILKINCILCFVLVCLPLLIKSQSETHLRSYQQHHYLTPHTRTLPNGQIQLIRPLDSGVNYLQKEVEDRHLKLLKFIKKKKKKKLKFFKKHFKKCGFPFKFKIVKKSDDDGDDYDTVRIKLPYGFGDEYYPRANRRNFNGTGEEDAEEDDDDEDEDDDDDSYPAETQNQFNNSPYQPPMRYRTMVRPTMQMMLPVPHPVFMNIPPFKPIRGPVPVFGPPRLMLPRRPPWPQRAPWAMARPGSFPLHYTMREPVPGVFVGSPPVSPAIKVKLEKHIPLNKTTTEDLKTQFSSYVPNYVHQSYNPYQEPVQGHTAFSNPSTYNAKYSQPDYGQYGSYHEASSASNNELVVVPLQKEEEKVVTVTPTTLWAANSPSYYHNRSSTGDKAGRSYLTGSPRLSNVRNLDSQRTSQVWVPLQVKNTTSANPFRIVVEDDQPEIITAKYPLESYPEPSQQNSSSKPILITKRNINLFNPKKRLVYFNIADARKNYYKKLNSTTENGRFRKISHILYGNSSTTSRIRRPRDENMSTLVSGSMIVKEN